jgi:hypothetical protein
MNKTDTKILVCCHTNDIYKSDEQYFPIHVGKEISDKIINIQGDNTGDNISEKNKSFCELTGMYWAWKNLPKSDYIGLCHYRRYFDFTSKFSLTDVKNIPTKSFDEKNIEFVNSKELLKNCDIILAHPKSYPYSLRIDYSICHLSKDFFILADVINDLYPDYSETFVEVMENNNKLCPYNMFLTRYEIFEKYSEWLFSILFECEKRIDISHYNVHQKRIFGYMSERLLMVYVKMNNLKIDYYPIIFYSDNNNNGSQLRYILRQKYNSLIYLLSKGKILGKKSEFYIKQKELYI